MNTATKQKVEELETIKIQAGKILDEFKTGVPPEHEVRLTGYLDRAKVLKGEIASAQKLEQKVADFDDITEFLERPLVNLPRGLNGIPEERKTLLRDGWEFRSGMACAPTSLEGKTLTYADGTRVTVGKLAMYPEEVLFGPIPDDNADQAAYFRRTRAIMGQEYKTAWTKYTRYMAQYHTETMAMSRLSAGEQKALSEGTDTSGGFIVPPDIQAEILAHMPQTAVMRQNCRVQPTNRDVLKFPAVAANAATYNGISGASILSSGFVGGWVGETPAFSDTDLSWQTLEIPIKKVRVATKLSNDFVSDAASNIPQYLAQNGAQNLALVEDYGFLSGIGAALQPLGILNSGITQTDVSGTTTHTISNTTSDLGSATKLITVAYLLPAQYASKAKWVMRRTIEGKIRKLVDGNNRYLWPPYTDSGFAGVGPELLGFPVLHSDWMPDDGTANNNVALLGDLTNYIIGQRTEITSLVLRERFADSDQIGIILFERVGGAIFNTDSCRLAYVNS